MLPLELMRFENMTVVGTNITVRNKYKERIIVFFFIQHVNNEVAYLQPHCSGVGK